MTVMECRRYTPPPSFPSFIIFLPAGWIYRPSWPLHSFDDDTRKFQFFRFRYNNHLPLHTHTHQIYTHTYYYYYYYYCCCCFCALVSPIEGFVCLTELFLWQFNSPLPHLKILFAFFLILGFRVKTNDFP